jgi:hypothetical protein
VHADGTFKFYYDDDGMCFGDGICVGGSLSAGPTEAFPCGI